MFLASALDGALFVRYDPNTEVVFAWFGGHGVNAYNDAGDELEHWNVGDFARPAAEVREVIASIDAWLAGEPDVADGSAHPGVV